MISYKQKLNKISTFILDVDGVLTDGKLILMPTGEMVRTMHTKDGFAMQLAIKKGFKIVVITGGKDVMVVERLKYLGVYDIYTGVHNKMEAYQDLLDAYDLKTEEVLYMGDDIPDLELLKTVGLSCCPNDAVAEIRTIAEYISPFKGGEGCVRDIIEQTMKVQGKWSDDYEAIASV